MRTSASLAAPLSTDTTLAALLRATPVDLSRSRALASKVRARNGECYRNAAYSLLTDIALQKEGARYVEGLVVAHSGLIMPMEHGWLELPDRGLVIDPTPVYCKRGTARRTYFEAFGWTAAEAYAILDEPGARWQFRQRFPDDGRQEPSWYAAALAACSAAEAHGRALGHSLLRDGTTIEQWARAL